MNYEQKYKEALDKLKQGLASEDGREINGITRNFLEEVFPELKESEDDRIRRELIEFIRTLPCTIHVKEEYFHWLEKQGEKKSIDMRIKEKAHQIAWETSKHYDPLLSKESWCEMAALDMAYWLEKQGEQKPAWSEEDEDMFLMCSDAIAAACAAGYYTTEEMHTMQNWLSCVKSSLLPIFEFGSLRKGDSCD